MNRVAADVSRRTCLLSSQRISADSRRRLQFSADRFVEVSPRKVVEGLSPGQAQVGRRGWSIGSRTGSNFISEK